MGQGCDSDGLRVPFRNRRNEETAENNFSKEDDSRNCEVVLRTFQCYLKGSFMVTQLFQNQKYDRRQPALDRRGRPKDLSSLMTVFIVSAAAQKGLTAY